MAYDTHARVTNPEPIWRSHKQGHFVEEIFDQLLWLSGDKIDLHEFLTNHRPPAKLFPVQSNEMRACGLFRDSFAVIDRALPLAIGKIVVVRIDGIVVMRRLMKKIIAGAWSQMIPANPTIFLLKKVRLNA